WGPILGVLGKPQALLPPEVVTQEMYLVVEDELMGQSLEARRRRPGVRRLRRVDGEDRPVDRVHGEKGRRHSATGLHELPAAQPELAAEAIGQRLAPFLDLPLRPRLVPRH